jgi:hypothetical protein
MKRLALIAAMILAGCGNPEEVSRVSSPTGDVDVVVAMHAHVTTVSDSYRIYLQARDDPTRKTEVADYFGLYGDGRDVRPEPVWVDNNTVEIRFPKARMGGVSRSAIRIGDRVVSVRSSGSIDMPSHAADKMRQATTPAEG